MLAKGMQILLHPTDILTAIRHEHHLLILLHALGLHQLPQSPSRFLVVGLNEPETLRRGTSPSSSRRKATTLLPAITSNHPCLCAARTYPPSMPTVIGPSGSGCCSQSSSDPSNRFSWRSSPSSCSIRSAVAYRCVRTVS